LANEQPNLGRPLIPAVIEPAGTALPAGAEGPMRVGALPSERAAESGAYSSALSGGIQVLKFSAGLTLHEHSGSSSVEHCGQAISDAEATV
jgi:hypothetical protein